MLQRCLGQFGFLPHRNPLSTPTEDAAAFKKALQLFQKIERIEITGKSSILSIYFDEFCKATKDKMSLPRCDVDGEMILPLWEVKDKESIANSSTSKFSLF